ncbi:MAG: hypothetical protein C0402_05960 [Thermodesulfovibrio sp.]|nr:hypothetical protein [Thermodesulfovibrio sp.]
MARVKGDHPFLDRRNNAGFAQPCNAETEVIMEKGYIQSDGLQQRPGLRSIAPLLLAAIVVLAMAATAFAGDIKSKAAVVMDAETGRLLYAKNPDLRLLPASTTKLMTALVVLERAKLSDVVTISKKVSLTPAMRIGLKEGDKVTVETLLYAALMKSANDATVALSEAVAGTEEQFVTLMNRKAIALGANDTRFINSNGLPGKGQYITAYDLSKIMRAAIKYPVLKEILNTRITEVSTEAGKTMFIKNTNKLLWSDEELLGGKTGYTRQARHCFVCAGERANDTIIVALLGAPARDLLWKESEELLTFGARVMNKTEEPVVYLARQDSEAMRVSPAVYTQEEGGRPEKIRISKGNKAKGRKTVLAKKNKTLKSSAQYAGKSRVKGKKTVLAGGNKAAKSASYQVKQKRLKKTLRGSQVAQKGIDGFKG